MEEIIKENIKERIESLEYYIENYKGMNIRLIHEWQKELNILKDKLNENN